MAKIPYTWSKVKAGDIISFRYNNSKDNRLVKRTVLVIDPMFKNKAKNKTSTYQLHGIQLEVSNRPHSKSIGTIATNRQQLRNLLEEAGKIQSVDLDKRIFKVKFDSPSAKSIYNKLKKSIKANGNFRTFSQSLLNSRRVYLEDIKLPAQFIKELSK